MKITVIGTGAVGQSLAKKLHFLGYKVFMGTRNVVESKSKTEADAWGGTGIGPWIREQPGVELLGGKNS